MRVLFCVTHKDQFNGYSLVGYELSKRIAQNPDVELMVYGFQRFHDTTPGHRMDYPSNIKVYDAWANENPRSAGFGFAEVADYVKANKPDVVVVYNDLMVVTEMLKGLKTARAAGCVFKILLYVDQVYLNQRRDFLATINEEADAIMTFSSYWEDILVKQGITKPTCFLHHGIDHMSRFPIDRKIARRYFNLGENDFIISNVTRNQPRKRWDICMQAFAEVLKTHRQYPIKLLVGTAVQGAWNLLDIFDRELRKRGMTMQEGMRHIVLVDNPQRMTDAAINVLYNTADVGINTCDGEGWGLTCFEQAALGIPQIASYVGGHREFFTDDCAILVKPTMTYYVDASRDAVGGEAELCSYKDFADAIIKYFENPELRQEHGRKSRENVLKNYHWDDVAGKFDAILHAVHEGTPVSEAKAVKRDSSVAAAVVEEEEIPKIKKSKTSSSKKKLRAAAPKKSIKELKQELDQLLLA